MEVKLDKIVPVYLEKEKVDTSEIWAHTIEFSGKHIHIVAPSGRGKSSLIQFMYGIRKDYRGTVLYNNTAVSGLSVEELSELRTKEISIVFQDLRLFPEHTAYQNISIKRDLLPYGKSMIDYMAERLGIGNKMQQSVRHCSYGEQQRIAIIRALQQPFSLLILDEPFSHLDENNSRIAMELIQEEAEKRNASILLLDLDRVPFFPADPVYHL